eukprot:jgi/Tetstr1/461572/TSEL_000599.t1
MQPSGHAGQMYLPGSPGMELPTYPPVFASSAPSLGAEYLFHHGGLGFGQHAVKFLPQMHLVQHAPLPKPPPSLADLPPPPAGTVLASGGPTGLPANGVLPIAPLSLPTSLPGAASAAARRAPPRGRAAPSSTPPPHPGPGSPPTPAAPCRTGAARSFPAAAMMSP